MVRHRKKKCCYCYNCLRKFAQRTSVTDQPACQACGGEVRVVMNKRVRAATVTRLKRLRGLKPPKQPQQPSAAPKTKYQEYLESELWREIRSRVMFRDKHKCVECGGKATQVHHLSYVGEVMEGRDDSQLISICRPCHAKRHPDKQPTKRRTRQTKAKRETKSEKRAVVRRKKQTTAMARDSLYHAHMCNR